MPFKPTPNPGILHHYTKSLVAFEHARESHEASKRPYNLILWLGGLGDGLLTVKYPRTLAHSYLPRNWSLVEVLIGASYGGWATSSLTQDAADLGKAVSYFRDVGAQRAKEAGVQAKPKLVLMGHSTGSNDVAEYLIGPRNAVEPSEEAASRPDVDGIVLHAGISDRESIAEAMDGQVWKDAVRLATRLVEEGRGGDVLPVGSTKGIYGTGVEPSAKRWLSLVTEGGDDDYFSSDLDETTVERIWGGNAGIASRTGRIQVLMGTEDEFIPKSVDMHKLLKKWEEVVKKGGGTWDDGSGFVEGASHNLNRSKEQAVSDMCSRVGRFLEKVEKSSTGEKL